MIEHGEVVVERGKLKFVCAKALLIEVSPGQNLQEQFYYILAA